MNNENRIPFDWDKYQSGEYEAICRDGSKAVIAGINRDARDSEQLIGWRNEFAHFYYINGKVNKSGENYLDIILIPKPKKFQKWINLYSDGLIYDFNYEDVAIEMSTKFEIDSRKYIKTILIEWEA